MAVAYKFVLKSNWESEIGDQKRGELVWFDVFCSDFIDGRYSCPSWSLIGWKLVMKSEELASRENEPGGRVGVGVKVACAQEHF